KSPDRAPPPFPHRGETRSARSFSIPSAALPPRWKSKAPQALSIAFSWLPASPYCHEFRRFAFYPSAAEMSMALLDRQHSDNVGRSRRAGLPSGGDGDEVAAADEPRAARDVARHLDHCVGRRIRGNEPRGHAPGKRQRL